jgi:uncharacterized protein DUF6980
MSKPTDASVTEQRCTCDYLQSAANDPDNPIIFDARTSEYQFTYQEPDCEGRAMLVIYHCPFCGGAAPESKRELLFAAISREEEERLAELMEPIKTIEDALAAFGPPDFDGHSSSRRPEASGQPPTIEHFRNIRYENLSEVAAIWITEQAHGRIFWELQGKPLQK